MDYIYAGTRAKVLKQKLLSETQTERLFGAKSVAETFKVLQDTFLAPYLAKHEKTDITEALDECIVDTKKLLKSIAPQPEILDVLWVKYDYHNLKTIIKGKRMGLGNEDITNLCFSAGIYAPEQILREYEKGDLRALNYHFHEAMEEAEHSERRYGIDVAMNTHYFKTIKTIADKTKDTFLRMFVALLVDTFNIKTALRSISLEELAGMETFVDDGTFSKDDLATTDNVFKNIGKIGGVTMWTRVIDHYKTTGNYGLIEKTIDEYITQFLMERGREVTSPAPLFSYFTRLKNNARIIGSIVATKRSGMNEKELRAVMRRVYN
ncbi:MAG: hypothetical protein COZ49_03420 [Candidatus Yonathbacteria bacterium CG_4_10_14_3_um_filter_47_65]|uniref:V-type ATP synthase subunit C n=2 Tax=Parcubacteria group TaxID=1794811 RepID=A0A2M8D705_9BACT|nr:MAG: hypothetical protein AUJ44_01270 [Candidatus Nomurabacteria bacterium CG1_02_47_685]PIP03491.1 MAG: hypothetical protein COX54_03565 [Candidatus Yonathbacteria bacterium CG23_combo_of_CG06-09_8_20_14_all_46_18]PIQ32945.1 MAG: hypothetical protein COW61_00525 [Candidatus Yonathbacteria bacterium CG17_big_fil_post_rev_8_21_14_2_50_46_19]PIX56166.1 MAG: hypothetical protein COZ49_03420 [Candidatus Yonathbacteria bacterium CG_4_10_14_3_um_filter_47_65]PIY57636.1 MAG: hypothetical protein CO